MKVAQVVAIVAALTGAAAMSHAEEGFAPAAMDFTSAAGLQLGDHYFEFRAPEEAHLSEGFVGLPSRQQESKTWRIVGGIAGGTGGFILYTPVALSDSRIAVSDGQRLLEWSAVTAGSAYLGYLLGRALDRR